MSFVAMDCSSIAAAMEETMSLTLSTTCETLVIPAIPPAVDDCTSAILPLISSVAAAVCLASALISMATTANPLPAEPARAASIVAFSASRLVCEEIPLRVSVIVPIWAAAVPSRFE
jgi:hypothetical protein